MTSFPYKTWAQNHHHQNLHVTIMWSSPHHRFLLLRREVSSSLGKWVLALIIYVYSPESQFDLQIATELHD